MASLANPISTSTMSTVLAPDQKVTVHVTLDTLIVNYVEA